MSRVLVEYGNVLWCLGNFWNKMTFYRIGEVGSMVWVELIWKLGGLILYFYPFNLFSVTPQCSSTRWEAFVYVSRFFVMCVKLLFYSIHKVSQKSNQCDRPLWKNIMVLGQNPPFQLSSISSQNFCQIVTNSRVVALRATGFTWLSPVFPNFRFLDFPGPESGNPDFQSVHVTQLSQEV